MDNTRKLTGTDVPEQAVNSIKSMIEDLADALVRDYNDGLKRNNQIINTSDLNVLKSYIVDNVSLSMAISLKIDLKVVAGLNININSLNQSDINGFNGME